MIGPGKYDDVATQAREAAEALGVILLVIGGRHGNGMSAQFTDGRTAAAIPMVLRDLADMIEEDNKKGHK